MHQLDQPIELAKYKGLKLVRSIELESWKLCSKQLFQFCCCWQPPKQNDNNNFLGGMCHVGLLDQSVVLYHVWWTRCGFISCYPSSHWPFRAQLLVRQRWFREPSPSWGAHRPHGNSSPETGHCIHCMHVLAVLVSYLFQDGSCGSMFIDPCINKHKNPYTWRIHESTRLHTVHPM